MNLGRIGHYHTPSGADEKGSCQVALVVDAGPAPMAGEEDVNLKVWTHAGSSEIHLGVPVRASLSGDYSAPVDESAATFHLNMDCPYRR